MNEIHNTSNNEIKDESQHSDLSEPDQTPQMTQIFD